MAGMMAMLTVFCSFIILTIRLFTWGAQRSITPSLSNYFWLTAALGFGICILATVCLMGLAVIDVTQLLSHAAISAVVGFIYTVIFIWSFIWIPVSFWAIFEAPNRFITLPFSYVIFRCLLWILGSMYGDSSDRVLLTNVSVVLLVAGIIITAGGSLAFMRAEKQLSLQS